MFDNDNDLSQLWGDTPASERKSIEVSDGKYDALVNTVRIEKSSTGKPMIKWDFIIQNNGQEGRHVFLNQLIAEQKQIAFVKGQLQQLGLNVSSLQTIQSELAGLLDCIVTITLKTKLATAEYEARQNVYLNKVVTKNEAKDEFGF